MRYLLLLLLSNPLLADDKRDFISKIFSSPPKPQRFWVDKSHSNFIKKHFNPSQVKLSYRYWQKNGKIVWILDEIGKERNITSGIVIAKNKVDYIEVITYRESRGGQVQSQRFRSQYVQKDANSNLAKEIDSISGATLSVNAINKQIRLALWLSSQLTPNKNET